MAYINTASNSSSFMARVSTFFDALATRRRQNRMFRQTFAELLSLIHISEPTRQAENSYAVFCLKKKNI